MKSFFRILTGRYNTFFLALLMAVPLYFVGHSPSGWAQTKEHEHQQNLTPGSQVHASGKEENKGSFFETYAPPKDISSNGWRMDWLFRYTSWVGAIFFMIMAGSLGFFIFNNRERPGHKAFYTHGTAKSNSAVTRLLDVAVFISLDLVLMAASYRDTKDFIWKYPTGPDVVKIQIMPQQWAWNFKYPGADGVFGTPDDIYTVNDMRIPKDKAILVQLKSRDVIHGFFIPNIRMQIDALPGAVTKMWFDAKDLGDYEIACVHHCGTAHYKMKAFLKVLEDEDYKAWTSEMSRWSAARYDTEDKSAEWGWAWGT